MEFLAKNGAHRCIGDFKDEIYQIRSFQEYSCTDQGIDRGASSIILTIRPQNIIFSKVREKAKEVVELITDEQKLEAERENAKRIKEKLQGNF